MNDSSDTPVLHEASVWTIKQKLIGLGTILLLLPVAVWYLYPDFLIMNPADESTSGTQVLSAETILFNAVPIAGNPLGLPVTGAINLDTKLFDLYWEYPGTSLAYHTDYYAALVMYPVSEPVDVIQPTLINTQSGDVRNLSVLDNLVSKTDLSVSSDLQYHTYTYFDPEESFSSDESSLIHQSIAVHNESSGDSFTIENAAKSIFIEDTQTLVYMKTDGVYTTDISTFRERLVLSAPQGLSVVDDFSISADGSILILTIPSRNYLSINRRSVDGTYAPEHQVESAAETGYFHPVISPDMSTYAVVRLDILDMRAEDSMLQAAIELRTTATSDVVDTILVEDDVIPESVQLTWWDTI